MERFDRFFLVLSYLKKLPISKSQQNLENHGIDWRTLAMKMVPGFKSDLVSALFYLIEKLEREPKSGQIRFYIIKCYNRLRYFMQLPATFAFYDIDKDWLAGILADYKAHH